MRNDIEHYTKEQLLDYIELLSKNWLAHDGCWFLSIEQKTDIETAMLYDIESWRNFTVIEAKRIKEFLHLPDQPGIEGLIQAIKLRLYANINVQEFTEVTATSCVFHMNACRVQTARVRKGLPDFPCRRVGDVEYGLFASAIDSRITTECLACPPGPHPKEYFCAWKFTLHE